VWTDVDVADVDIFLGKRGGHVSVDMVYIFLGHQAFCDPGLVRGYEEHKVLLKYPQRFESLGEEDHFRRIPHMPTILNDRAISIQKYSNIPTTIHYHSFSTT
jgi:hypothetical protein